MSVGDFGGSEVVCCCWFCFSGEICCCCCVWMVCSDIRFSVGMGLRFSVGTVFVGSEVVLIFGVGVRTVVNLTLDKFEVGLSVMTIPLFLMVILVTPRSTPTINYNVNQSFQNFSLNR